MKLTSIQITGNVRLIWAGINEIKMDLTTTCQVIIGTNGAGKSTIIRELSFLPPNGPDYISGGMKIVTGEHQGIEYIASSVLEGASWAHSLIKVESNGEHTELNAGHTKAVQKQLVEEIMGINEGIFDIFVGDVQFTQMTPQKRREWILSLSGSDLEYAMRVYKKVTGKVRDSKALIEHYSRRLATEIETEITESTLQTLNDEVKEVLEVINSLMLDHVPNLPDSNRLSHEIQTLVENIERHSNQLIHSDLAYTLKEPFDGKYESLTSMENKFTESIDNATAELSALYKQADAIDQFLKRIASQDSSSLAELEAKVDKKQAQVEQLTKQLSFLHLSTPAVKQRRFDRVKFALSDAIAKLPHDFDITELKEEEEKLQQKIPFLKGRIIQIEAMRTDAERHLYHLNSVDQVDCTKCGNQFKPGVDDLKIANYKAEIAQCGTALVKHQSLLEEAIDRLGLLSEHLECERFLRNTLTELELPSTVFKAMLTDSGKLVDSHHLSTVIQGYEDDLALSLQIDQLKNDLALTCSVLDTAKQLKLGQNELNTDQLSVIEQRIDAVLSKKIASLKDLKTCRDFKVRWEELLNVRHCLSNEHHELLELVGQYLSCIENEALLTSINDHQLYLAERKAKINQNDLKRSLIKELTSQREEAIENHKVYDITAQQLSPVNGLIAQRIRSFIDEFIGQMNQVISQVWTYQMEIKATGLESDDINCKFPLLIEKDNSDGIGKLETPDIAKSSSSQTDIINFSFRLVAMMCMGLTDYPLFLDEVGIRMDEVHRERFNGMLASMLESQRFSQMFIVSHHIDMHGLFTQAKICVLNSDNLLNLPEVYNTHVVIT